MADAIALSLNQAPPRRGNHSRLETLARHYIMTARDMQSRQADMAHRRIGGRRRHARSGRYHIPPAQRAGETKRQRHIVPLPSQLSAALDRATASYAFTVVAAGCSDVNGLTLTRFFVRLSHSNLTVPSTVANKV